MGKTITANSGPITLAAGSNPLSIVSGVTVSALFGAAIYGDASAAWIIDNGGSLLAASPFGYGIELAGGGTVTNTGTISAGDMGVWLKGGPAVVLNEGGITGSADGVVLSNGGSVETDPGNSIIGGVNGVYAFGSGTADVTNLGTITGTGPNADGVHLLSGGSVINNKASTISGGAWGVYLAGSVATYVGNFSTISGGTGAVHFGNANGNVLAAYPGDVFNGQVEGGSGSDTLELRAANSVGTFSGIGSEFTGFEALEVYGGWLLAGGNFSGGALAIQMPAFEGSLKVIGTLTAPGSLLLSGIGQLAANDGGRIEVGTAGAARVGQIVIDAGHTLTETGTVAVAAPVIINRGSVTGSGFGFNVSGVSSVTNSGTAAHISGAKAGVKFAAGGSTLVNQGTIAATGGYGVTLGSGVVINSGTAADIAGFDGGVYASGVATISNQGRISTNSGAGVRLKAGGTVSNLGTAASIFGVQEGVLEVGGAAVITNLGGISGENAGIDLLTGGTIVNTGTAARIAGESGIISVASTTITNQGTIYGDVYRGVELAGGGIITNSGTAAEIFGGNIGAEGDALMMVTNQGRIIGGHEEGVLLSAGGTVVNSGAGASISGVSWGVYADAAATITNQGRIAGATVDGVYLGAGGVVTNSGTASQITGADNGVYSSGAAATIVNQGSITGTAEYGVFLEAGGTVSNSGIASRIYGAQYGVGASRGVALVINQGSIFGDDGAVYLGGGGSVRNLGTAALLSGGRWGVYAYGSVGIQVTNFGTISGGNGAVHFDNANNNLFQDLPGSVVQGVVQGGTGTDMLELSSAAATGTISGIGSVFTGFETVQVDAGGHWLVSGANTLVAQPMVRLNGSLGVAGTLVAPGSLVLSGGGTLSTSGGRVEVGTAGSAASNQIVVDAGHVLVGSGVLTAPVSGGGTLEVTAGTTLTLDGAGNALATVVNDGTLDVGAGDTLDVTGSVDPGSIGLWVLGNAATLEVAADAGAGGAIAFLGSGGLVVDAVAKFGTKVGTTGYAGPLIERFGASNSIDLKDLVSAGASDIYNAATGLLQLTSGSVKATLAFQTSSLGAGSFHIGIDGHGDVLLTHG